MIFSMTGYGKAKQPLGSQTLTVEIKSVNFKGIDLRMKSPFSLGEKELILRKTVSETVERGRVDVVIEVNDLNNSDTGNINEELLEKYILTLNKLVVKHNLQNVDLISSIFRIPDVLGNGNRVLEEDEWAILQSTVDTAIDRFLIYRKEEGIALENDFLNHVDTIEHLIKQIAPFENERIDRQREKMMSTFEDLNYLEKLDQNRFEQELIYYIEKLDISEEKVRLEQHCKYFREVLSSEDASIGRNLNFISQEMGREINTIGSKANHSELQKIVIMMKDELEKIKEQTANIV